MGVISTFCVLSFLGDLLLSSFDLMALFLFSSIIVFTLLCISIFIISSTSFSLFYTTYLLLRRPLRTNYNTTNPSPSIEFTPTMPTTMYGKYIKKLAPLLGPLILSAT